MIKSPTISLSIPNADSSGGYFSFRLKQDLNIEKSEYQRSKKMFVISDIEGNFQSFCKLLVKAKVVNKYLQWIFEDNRLVILGDCFDRGEDVIECLWLIYSLEEKAKLFGGHVHFILGNHEIMNMNADWRYVHPKYAEITRPNKPHTALYHGNNELWKWLSTKNIIEKIGDLLFVHGGISEPLLSLNLSLSEINKQVRPYYTKAYEQFTDPFLQIVFNSEYSPFWYRGYYQQPENIKLIEDTLERYKVKRIITGHTIVEKVTTFYDTKVINIDTDHTAGNSEALLISRHRYYRVPQKGKRERIEIPRDKTKSHEKKA